MTTMTRRAVLASMFALPVQHASAARPHRSRTNENSLYLRTISHRRNFKLEAQVVGTNNRVVEARLFLTPKSGSKLPAASVLDILQEETGLVQPYEDPETGIASVKHLGNQAIFWIITFPTPALGPIRIYAGWIFTILDRNRESWSSNDVGAQKLLPQQTLVLSLGHMGADQQSEKCEGQIL